jgi:hypothetical protein
MGGAGFDWLTAGSTGCSVRGNGVSGEYYRLACSCSVDSGSGNVVTDGYWKVYYFDTSDCSSHFAESVGAVSGYCGGGDTPTATTQSPSDDENGDDGPASSVSVSLLAIFGAILAVFKSL